MYLSHFQNNNKLWAKNLFDGMFLFAKTILPSHWISSEMPIVCIKKNSYFCSCEIISFHSINVNSCEIRFLYMNDPIHFRRIFHLLFFFRLNAMGLVCFWLHALLLYVLLTMSNFSKTVVGVAPCTTFVKDASLIHLDCRWTSKLVN